jgi:hypothetical protein
VLAIGGVDAKKRGFVDAWDLGGVFADPAEKLDVTPIPNGEKKRGEAQSEKG